MHLTYYFHCLYQWAHAPCIYIYKKTPLIICFSTGKCMGTHDPPCVKILYHWDLTKRPQKKEKARLQIKWLKVADHRIRFNLPLLSCLFYKYYMINVEEFLLSSDSTYGRPAGVYIWAVCISSEQTAACGLSCSSSHCYGTATCKLQRN